MDKEIKQELFRIFKRLGAEGLALNHYELTAVTGEGTPDLWKQFLIDPEISAYIKQESDILLQTELRKLSKDASQSRSVGQAQLINALGKISEDTSTKEGPAFIYTYIPLTPAQALASNIQSVDHDIFLKEDKPKDIEMTVNIDEEEF